MCGQGDRGVGEGEGESWGCKGGMGIKWKYGNMEVRRSTEKAKAGLGDTEAQRKGRKAKAKGKDERQRRKAKGGSRGLRLEGTDFGVVREIAILCRCRGKLTFTVYSLVGTDIFLAPAGPVDGRGVKPKKSRHDKYYRPSRSPRAWASRTRHLWRGGDAAGVASERVAGFARQGRKRTRPPPESGRQARREGGTSAAQCRCGGVTPAKERARCWGGG